MKYENLSELCDILSEYMEDYGHFMMTLRGCNFLSRDKINVDTVDITSTARGVVRTNCMDCLDRTNVVQSVFSRQIAFKQLHLLGIGKMPQGKNPFEMFAPNLERAFRDAWTHNANQMSTLYTGTPALKTDFTRTGKRTYMGAVDDGVNSVTRYFINNFNDGYNHDSLDICTGKLQPSAKLHRKSLMGPIKSSIVGMVFTYVILNSFMNSYLPVQEDSYKS
jgi:hypothetical protein